jgi:glucose uptake protein
MMQNLGTGKGFTIAQLCVVVNALMGVFWEHTPRPGTRAAYLTLAGVVVATIGAAVLGNLK